MAALVLDIQLVVLASRIVEAARILAEAARSLAEAYKVVGASFHTVVGTVELRMAVAAGRMVELGACHTDLVVGIVGLAEGTVLAVAYIDSIVDLQEPSEVVVHTLEGAVGHSIVAAEDSRGNQEAVVDTLESGEGLIVVLLFGFTFASSTSFNSQPGIRNVPLCCNKAQKKAKKNKVDLVHYVKRMFLLFCLFKEVLFPG